MPPERQPSLTSFTQVGAGGGPAARMASPLVRRWLLAMEVLNTLLTESPAENTPLSAGPGLLAQASRCTWPVLLAPPQPAAVCAQPWPTPDRLLGLHVLLLSF